MVTVICPGPWNVSLTETVGSKVGTSSTAGRCLTECSYVRWCKTVDALVDEQRRLISDPLSYCDLY